MVRGGGGPASLARGEQERRETCGELKPGCWGLISGCCVEDAGCYRTPLRNGGWVLGQGPQGGC